MNKSYDNIDTICFCGAVVVGFACIGVMDYIESHNIININNINTFAGTSSGAFIALYYALNYTTKEIIDITNNLNLQDIFNIKISNIIKLKELNDGSKILNLINTLIYNKCNKYDITFYELYNLTNKKLIIIGYNKTLEKETVFSYDYTPNMSIAIAVRISTSLPILFTPVLYNNNYYIDGGIVNFFPYNHCNPKTTLGIYIKIIDNINIFHKINNIINYNQQIKPQYNINIITIKFADVHRYDFSINYINNIINYSRIYTKNYFTFKINSANNNTNNIIIIISIILLIIFILYYNKN